MLTIGCQINISLLDSVVSDVTEVRADVVAGLECKHVFLEDFGYTK